MKHSHLDQLIESKTIKSYKWVRLDVCGRQLDDWDDKQSFSEELVLEFYDGNFLYVDAEPGYRETAYLVFETNPHLSQDYT